MRNSGNNSTQAWEDFYRHTFLWWWDDNAKSARRLGDSSRRTVIQHMPCNEVRSVSQHTAIEHCLQDRRSRIIHQTQITGVSCMEHLQTAVLVGHSLFMCVCKWCPFRFWSQNSYSQKKKILVSLFNPRYLWEVRKKWLRGLLKCLWKCR